MPKVGDIAYCGLNTLGLITNAERQPVIYKDGTTAMAYVGIHLTDKIANIGDPWSSRNPTIVGNINEVLINLLDTIHD